MCPRSSHPLVAFLETQVLVRWAEVVGKRHRWSARGPGKLVDSCRGQDEWEWLAGGVVVLVQHPQSHQQTHLHTQVDAGMWEGMRLG